ncbi:MAG: HAL/PAL/TAL family ammonia-lyase, partial [Anaerovoracaceae bacterium]
PLSHIVITMMGEGTAEYQGKVMSSKSAMKKAGIETIELAAKEGLALINGTQVMTAIGLLTLYDGIQLAKIADIAGALTSEALNGIRKAYDAKVHNIRGQKGQKEAAESMRQLLRGSENVKKINPNKVQDPYSLRCIPQIHGASRDAMRYVYDVVTIEINAVTDNPLIFPDENEVISGGNFHGQPMALAFDFLKNAISELANVSERRSERLINPQLSEGLPAFLTPQGGLHSGFMIAQYSAASMVSENKVYAHPACVDSIPSSGNQEDHVSMGTTSARTAAMVLDNSQKVLGIELFSATQALHLRGIKYQKGLAKATAAAYEYIRTQVRPLNEDILMYPEMEKFDNMIKDGSLLDAVEAAIK